MSKKNQFNKESEDMALNNGNDTDMTADTDNYYNEEMSRAAVGRLFDDDDDPPPKPGKSAFVTGFDRTPARKAGGEPQREEFHAPRGERTVREDPPAPRAERPVREEPPAPRAERSVREEPPAPRTERNIRGDTKETKIERPHRGEPVGRPERPERPPRGEIHEMRAERAEKPEPPRAEKPHPQEEDAGRPRRRESATTRLIHGETPDDLFEAGFRDGTASRERGRRRPSGTDPRPPRAAAEGEQPQQGEAGAPEEADFDKFRQRFNPNELVSSPKNQNRPVRPGQERERPPQEREARVNRARPAERDAEAISPLKWIIAGAAVAVLVLVVILSSRIIILSRDLNAARDELAEAEGYADDVQRLTSDLYFSEEVINELNDTIDNLQNQLVASGIIPDPDFEPPVVPPGGGGAQGTTPPVGGTLTPTPLPELPTTHIVVGGDTLIAIARRYYGGRYDDDILWHIVNANTNRMSNPNSTIQAGWELVIPAAPPS